MSRLQIQTLPIKKYGGITVTAGKCQRPNCGGDLFIVRDIDGWQTECSLCSHSKCLTSDEIVKYGLSPRRLSADISPYTQTPMECSTGFKTVAVFANYPQRR